MKLKECTALQWFGQEVGSHCFCGAILDGQITIGNAIGGKEIAHVDVMGALGTQQFTIFLKKHDDLVVLVEHHCIKLEILSLKEVVGPQQDGHKIIGSN